MTGFLFSINAKGGAFGTAHKGVNGNIPAGSARISVRTTFDRPNDYKLLQ